MTPAEFKDWAALQLVPSTTDASRGRAALPPAVGARLVDDGVGQTKYGNGGVTSALGCKCLHAQSAAFAARFPTPFGAAAAAAILRDALEGVATRIDKAAARAASGTLAAAAPHPPLDELIKANASAKAQSKAKANSTALTVADDGNDASAAACRDGVAPAGPAASADATNVAPTPPPYPWRTGCMDPVWCQHGCDCGVARTLPLPALVGLRALAAALRTRPAAAAAADVTATVASAALGAHAAAHCIAAAAAGWAALRGDAPTTPAPAAVPGPATAAGVVLAAAAAACDGANPALCASAAAASLLAACVAARRTAAAECSSCECGDAAWCTSCDTAVAAAVGAASDALVRDTTGVPALDVAADAVPCTPTSAADTELLVQIGAAAAATARAAGALAAAAAAAGATPMSAAVAIRGAAAHAHSAATTETPECVPEVGRSGGDGLSRRRYRGPTAVAPTHAGPAAGEAGTNDDHDAAAAAAAAAAATAAASACEAFRLSTSVIARWATRTPNVTQRAAAVALLVGGAAAVTVVCAEAVAVACGGEGVMGQLADDAHADGLRVGPHGVALAAGDTAAAAAADAMRVPVFATFGSVDASGAKSGAQGASLMRGGWYGVVPRGAPGSAAVVGVVAGSLLRGVAFVFSPSVSPTLPMCSDESEGPEVGPIASVNDIAATLCIGSEIPPDTLLSMVADGSVDRTSLKESIQQVGDLQLPVSTVLSHSVLLGTSIHFCAASLAAGRRARKRTRAMAS